MKGKVVHGGDCHRPKRTNTTEMHWGSDHPVSNGWIYDNHHAHEWRIHAFVWRPH